MRVWWRFCKDEDFATSSRLACECQPAKQATWKAHAGIWRVFDRLDFTSHSWLRPSHEWPVKLSAWLFWVCLFSYLYQHYINPHYPRKVSRTRSIHKKLLRENTLAKQLRVRDCLPTILNISSLEFPFTPTSSSIYPSEVFSPNTYLTHFECWKEFWCLWEVLEEAIKWQMQSGRIARFG